MERRVLIIDDDPACRQSLKKLLEARGFQSEGAGSCGESLRLSPSLKFDLAIVDLNLGDGSGADLIARLKQIRPGLQSILITGASSINVTIIESLKKGVFHFMPKPFEPEALFRLISEVLRQKEILEQNQNLRENLKRQFHFSRIIGKSGGISRLTEIMRKVAKSRSNLLITGESGTGKELVARSIHCAAESARPFISVNCGAIPKELLESEFFGHIKGSFTGAIRNQKGCFQAAEDGTLFLDEIGAMDLSLQVKLLRVLQEREFRPVGGTEAIAARARIVAATNIDLEKAVEQGRFRKDLFYRLNIIPLFVPPLRERRSDIPLLIRHFIDFFNKSHSSGIEGLSPEAMSALCGHQWPGNIRELENLIERLSVLKGSGLIQLRDLPDKYKKPEDRSSRFEAIEMPAGGMDFNSAVGAYEDAIILKALKKTNWNRRRAAGLLSLNRTTLIEKLKKKGLRKPPPDISDSRPPLES